MIVKTKKGEIKDLTTVKLAFWGESVGNSHQVFHRKNDVGVTHHRYFSLQENGWLVEKPISFEIRSLILNTKIDSDYAAQTFEDGSVQFRIGDRYYGDFPLKRNGIYALEEKEVVCPFQTLNVIVTYPRYVEAFYSGEILLGLFRPVN